MAKRMTWQVQLLLIIAIIAVIGSLLRGYNREHFDQPVGITPSATIDENGLLNGTISVKSLRGNNIGDSQLTDKDGNIVLVPNGIGNIKLQGDTEVTGNLKSKSISLQDANVTGVLTANPIKIGDAFLKQDDDWIRVTQNPNDPYPANNYNRGLAAKSLWAREHAYIGGKAFVGHSIVMNDKPVLLRGQNDNNHVLAYDAKYDGPRLDGFRSGRLGIANGNNESLVWDANRVTVKKQLCVDDQCVSSSDFQKLKAPAPVIEPTSSLSGNKTFEFGTGVQGKEINAGKIGYGTWDTNALNIVGAGAPGKTRVTRVFDALQLGDAIFKQDDDWVRITGNRDNALASESYNKGLAAKNLWARDNVYTNTASAQKLCLGGTCIDETDLQVLTGKRNLALKRAGNNYTLGIDNNGNYFKTSNYNCSAGDGCYESLRVVKK